MVFSSVPLYLDPPNWQQQGTDQQVHQVIGGSGGGQNETPHHHHHNHLLQQQQQHLQVLPPLQPPLQLQTNGQLSGPTPSGSTAANTTTTTTSNRPSSMSERARLAKMIPHHAPDGGPLKCPRCESTNTKFCYFNNYSLTQPRHFCKTCRRYWTLGGALRNVPVGGGCRRNNSKRGSKGAGGSNRSKSPAVSTGGGHEPPQQQTQQQQQHGIGQQGGNISSSALLSQFAGLSNNSNLNAPPQFSFMGSLQNLTAQLGIGNSGNSNLGLGMRYGTTGRIDHQMGTGQVDFAQILQQQQQHQAQQQQQHLPLLTGFGLYPFQNETTTMTTTQPMYVGGPRGSAIPEMFMTRPKTSESVKMEELQGGIQLGHHPSLTKDHQLSSGDQQPTDHHLQQQQHDHNRSSSTPPHIWAGNSNASANNNNNSNGLVPPTSASNLWTDLSGLN